MAVAAEYACFGFAIGRSVGGAAGFEDLCDVVAASALPGRAYDVERSLELLSNINIAGVVLNDSIEPTELGYY